jgi:hypothetical protein
MRQGAAAITHPMQGAILGDLALHRCQRLGEPFARLLLVAELRLERGETLTQARGFERPAPPKADATVKSLLHTPARRLNLPHGHVVPIKLKTNRDIPEVEYQGRK